MGIIAEVVSAGRATFESFRSILINCLSSTKCVGDVSCFQRCSEGISHLEVDLATLEDLKHADRRAQAESIFVKIQAEETSRYIVVQQSLSEKELHTEHSRKEYTQRQNELAVSTDALNSTRATITQIEENIAQLQAALARQKVEFAQDEAIVTSLSIRSVEALINHRRDTQVFKEAKKEAAATIMPSEDELLKRADAIA